MDDMKKNHQKESQNLALNIIRLSKILTRERDNLSAAYLRDRELREAYQAYFLPPNLAKIRALLCTFPSQERAVLKKGNLRILDLGCGPGTATLGALEFFAAEKTRPALTFVAVDQVSENLKIAEDLFNASRSRHDLVASLKTVRSSIEDAVRLAETPFDLIILSNVLNELFVHEKDRIARRIALVQGILDHFLSHDGNCIIIEPALRATSRELLGVRDGLIELDYAVIAPCLRQSKCPALANPKDWCHEDIPWDPPDRIRKLDRLAGLRKDSLKFSYLVLRHTGEARTPRFSENSFRVVSDLLISKGKTELYLCGESGRSLAVRLDKDAAPENEVFEKLRRGDIACFERLIDEGKRLKIGKETAIIRGMPR
jgi:ribosomal protein RSM22 (predicted rRNA methylase)